MVGQRGFEPLTNGYLQLQNFVIPRRVSIPILMLLEPIVIPGYTTTPHHSPSFYNLAKPLFIDRATTKKGAVPKIQWQLLNSCYELI